MVVVGDAGEGLVYRVGRGSLLRLINSGEVALDDIVIGSCSLSADWWCRVGNGGEFMSYEVGMYDVLILALKGDVCAWGFVSVSFKVSRRF